MIRLQLALVPKYAHSKSTYKLVCFDGLGYREEADVHSDGTTIIQVPGDKTVACHLYILRIHGLLKRYTLAAIGVLPRGASQCGLREERRSGHGQRVGSIKRLTVGGRDIPTASNTEVTVSHFSHDNATRWTKLCRASIPRHWFGGREEIVTFFTTPKWAASKACMDDIVSFFKTSADLVDEIAGTCPDTELPPHVALGYFLCALSAIAIEYRRDVSAEGAPGHDAYQAGCPYACGDCEDCTWHVLFLAECLIRLRDSGRKIRHEPLERYMKLMSYRYVPVAVVVCATKHVSGSLHIFGALIDRTKLNVVTEGAYSRPADQDWSDGDDTSLPSVVMDLTHGVAQGGGEDPGMQEWFGRWQGTKDKDGGDVCFGLHMPDRKLVNVIVTEPIVRGAPSDGTAIYAEWVPDAPEFNLCRFLSTAHGTPGSLTEFTNWHVKGESPPYLVDPLAMNILNVMNYIPGPDGASDKPSVSRDAGRGNAMRIACDARAGIRSKVVKSAVYSPE